MERKYLLAIILILIISIIIKWHTIKNYCYNNNNKYYGINIYDNKSFYNENNFDKALFINGPKYSLFEDDEDNRQSLKHVKEMAAISLKIKPEKDDDDDVDSQPESFFLKSNLIPAEVYYFWCLGNLGRTKRQIYFEYKNYLSIKSAIKNLHPDKIFILMEKYPEMDRVIYNQWLDELKKDYPYLYIQTMNPQQRENYCESDDVYSKLAVVIETLDEGFGGIFMTENIFILNYKPLYRSLNLDFGIEVEKEGEMEGFLTMKGGLFTNYKKNYNNNNTGNNNNNNKEQLIYDFLKENLKEIINNRKNIKNDNNKNNNNKDYDYYYEYDNKNQKIKNKKNNKQNNDVSEEEEEEENDYLFKSSISSCAHVRHLNFEESIKLNVKCLVVKGNAFNNFYPMDIWQLDKPFGRLCRKIYYGNERVRLPVPNYNELVPNIGHMIWIGGRNMDFMFYLSVLSTLFIAKLDVLYIHGDIEPGGEYWRELKNLEQTRDRVKFIYRTQPYYIYQGEVEKFYYALMSDLMRVELMIKYGGVYTDTDAIWVKPLSLGDRGYEAVASYDWIDWSYPFQDTVNFGISYGKKNSPYWRLFRDSMRVLHNDLHGFTGVMNPYKILERHPEMLRIDRRLSVICYHSKCHPTYYPGYHDIENNHLTRNSIPNWRKNVNAFHWTFPNPTEYSNKTSLLRSKGIFADLGKAVLRAAGIS